MISSWVTDAAPWRCAVPRQSAPVSPPPRITTCLPADVIGEDAPRRFAGGRYSMAWWIPASERPGTGRSRATRAPPASTTAENPSSCAADSTLTPHENTVPSARICPSRRSRWRFSILNSGMPYRSSPPGASSRSKTVTMCPARVSCCAAASPDGPEPTTATEKPDSAGGGTGTTPPAAQARSMISTSTCLIVTGSALMPSTQAASHGAGHSRPVNSGKLFVACSRSAATAQSEWYTRSFHSGMRLPSGQPLWQNGIPQSMHRAACRSARSRANGSYTSRQSVSRTSTGRRRGVSRAVVKNPFGSPIASCPSPVRGRHHGLVHVTALALGGRGRHEDPLVVLRHDLGEPLHRLVPRGEQPPGDRGPGFRVVPRHHVAQERDVGLLERVEVHHLRVQPGLRQVEHVGDAAGHARREVPPGRPEDDH